MTKKALAIAEVGWMAMPIEKIGSIASTSRSVRGGLAVLGFAGREALSQGNEKRQSLWNLR